MEKWRWRIKVMRSHSLFFSCMANTCGAGSGGAEGKMPTVMPVMPAMPSGQWKLQMTFAVCQLGADGGSDGEKAEIVVRVRFGVGGGWGGGLDHLEQPPVHHLQSPGPYGSARLCPVWMPPGQGWLQETSDVSRPGLSGNK